MGPLMINMAFMPLYMWEMWDVTPVTNTRTVESRAVFCLSRIRNLHFTVSGSFDEGTLQRLKDLFLDMQDSRPLPKKKVSEVKPVQGQIRNIDNNQVNTLKNLPALLPHSFSHIESPCFLQEDQNLRMD